MPAKLESIAEGWASYERNVLPADAGPVQRSETQRSFYAGAWFLVSSFLRIGEPDVPIQDGSAYLKQIRKDLESFARSVGAKGGE